MKKTAKEVKVIEKENHIVLFRNNNIKNEKSPTLRGNVNINGEKKWISMWSRISKSGIKYWFGSILNDGEIKSDVTITMFATRGDNKYSLEGGFDMNDRHYDFGLIAKRGVNGEVRWEGDIIEEEFEIILPD